MRLYLTADSERGVGYTPDWLQFTFKENGEAKRLTLDIQGFTEYDTDKFHCRSKTDLIPWVLINSSGDEVDLSTLDENEVEAMFSAEKLAELLENGSDFVVGIYPADHSNDGFKVAESDVISNTFGVLEILVGETFHQIEFPFEVELPLD